MINSDKEYVKEATKFFCDIVLLSPKPVSWTDVEQLMRLNFPDLLPNDMCLITLISPHNLRFDKEAIRIRRNSI